jgi:hypothetical protein
VNDCEEPALLKNTEKRLKKRFSNDSKHLVPASRNQVHIKLFSGKKMYSTHVQYTCKMEIFK